MDSLATPNGRTPYSKGTHEEKIRTVSQLADELGKRVIGLTLQPSEQTHVPASALGHPATDKYLSVYNASEIAEGEWEVEL